MVIQPPTRAPTCSRDRSSGPDHGPAAEITLAADHDRRPKVLGTDQKEEAVHRGISIATEEPADRTADLAVATFMSDVSRMERVVVEAHADCLRNMREG